MSFVNYVLIGLLGTILGIALYMTKVELSDVHEFPAVPEQNSNF